MFRVHIGSHTYNVEQASTEDEAARAAFYMHISNGRYDGLKSDSQGKLVPKKILVKDRRKK